MKDLLRELRPQVRARRRTIPPRLSFLVAASEPQRRRGVCRRARPREVDKRRTLVKLWRLGGNPPNRLARWAQFIAVSERRDDCSKSTICKRGRSTNSRTGLAKDWESHRPMT